MQNTFKIQNMYIFEALVSHEVPWRNKIQNMYIFEALVSHEVSKLADCVFLVRTSFLFCVFLVCTSFSNCEVQCPAAE